MSAHHHSHDHLHPNDHRHTHDHGTAHGSHDHAHFHPTPDPHNRAFGIGIALNLGFVAVEAGFGWTVGSLALLADAGHNLSDVIGLVLAWLAYWLSRRPAQGRRTYGYGRATILASLANAVLLFMAVGAIIVEAVQRFSSPVPVASGTVAVVAAVGIAVNALTAWLFVAGSRHDLNMRGAFLHMAADAAVSLGVVLAGIGMRFTGWSWLDPAMSMVIALVIAFTTWGLLRESAHMAMDVVPAHIDQRAVEAYLRALPGVTAVHDMHIWPLSTTAVALTAHVVMPGGSDGVFLNAMAETLRERFAIGHVTVQIEDEAYSAHCPLLAAHSH